MSFMGSNKGEVLGFTKREWHELDKYSFRLDEDWEIYIHTPTHVFEYDGNMIYFIRSSIYQKGLLHVLFYTRASYSQ